MHAPLATFLTHFSAPPPLLPAALSLSGDPLELAFEVETVAPESGLDMRIESAVEEARQAAADQHRTDLAALAAAHEEQLAQAVAAAREDWARTIAETLAQSLDEAVTGLRTMLSERIANVLRPLLAEAVRVRATAELAEALDRLLGDSSQPLLRMSGPEDLAEILLTGRPAAAIEWTVAETIDIELIADGTRIETKLAAALAEIAATETTDVG